MNRELIDTRTCGIVYLLPTPFLYSLLNSSVQYITNVCNKAVDSCRHNVCRPLCKAARVAAEHRVKHHVQLEHQAARRGILNMSTSRCSQALHQEAATGGGRRRPGGGVGRGAAAAAADASARTPAVPRRAGGTESGTTATAATAAAAATAATGAAAAAITVLRAHQRQQLGVAAAAEPGSVWQLLGGALQQAAMWPRGGGASVSGGWVGEACRSPCPTPVLSREGVILLKADGAPRGTARWRHRPPRARPGRCTRWGWRRRAGTARGQRSHRSPRQGTRPECQHYIPAGCPPTRRRWPAATARCTGTAPQ